MRRQCDEGVRPLSGDALPCARKGDGESRSGVSAEVIVVGDSAGKARPRRRRTERAGVISDMSMQKAQRQMPANAGREAEGLGEAMPDAFSNEAFCPRHATADAGSALLQATLTTGNLRRALKRVRANKGASGVDGLAMTNQLFEAALGIQSP